MMVACEQICKAFCISVKSSLHTFLSLYAPLPVATLSHPKRAHVFGIAFSSGQPDVGVGFFCFLTRHTAIALSLADNRQQQNALDHRFFTKSMVKPAKLKDIVVRT